MSEEFIYQDQRVSVTTKMITIDGITYPVASISSIKIQEAGKGWSGPLLAIFGVLIIAVGLMPVGVIVLLLAGALMLWPSDYHLVIRNASGEAVALVAKEREYVEKIRRELERAIAGQAASDAPAA